MRTVARLVRQQVAGMRASLGVFAFFRRDLLRRWPLLLGALACSLGYGAVRVAEPWPLQVIFDNVLGTRPFDSPVPLLGGLVADDRRALLAAAAIALLVFAGLRGVLYAWQITLATRVGQEVVLRLRRRLFRRIQKLGLDFHARSSTGDLLTRLTSDVDVLRELMVGGILSILSEGLVLVAFLAVMYVMEWRLALLATVAMPVVFVLMLVYGGRIRASTREQRRTESELAGRVAEVLNGIHLVQLFARERDEDERLRRLNKRSLRTGMQTTRLEARANRAVEVSVAFATAATLWVGANQVIAGRLTPGELLVFVAYMQTFYRPLKRLARVSRRASRAAVSVERIAEVLALEPSVADGPRDAPALRGAVELRGVSHAYVEGVPVLDQVDLAIAPGQMVALVGPTGAGKSTILGLVPRLHDPAAGAVLVDGLDVRDLTLRSLREQIAVVPQDGVLFGGTIRDNIAYGRPDASEDELVAAAQAALVDEFVSRLPDGYDTVVGERGVTLSGGQRQRLAIARALVKDAPIVLLDEPTTGLDAGSEALVLEALERLLDGRTSLVIAHRLRTIERADRIAVVERGRIVQVGTHDYLAGRGGPYAELLRQQFGVAPSTPPAPAPVRRPVPAMLQVLLGL
ncbi:MAG: ABC transporter ATP-binding protein [Thermoleophilia bacterium]